MIKVKCFGSWCSDEVMLTEVIGRQVENKQNFTFGNIQFIIDDYGYDYAVLMNYPNKPYDPRKSLLFQFEPKPIRNTWPKITPWKDYSIDSGNYHMPIMWHVPIDYNYLLNDIPEKTNLFSGCFTKKISLEGHKLRMDFIDNFLCNPKDQFDLFGPDEWNGFPNYKGWKPKQDTLRPYKYCFNAENYIEPLYFTEKLYDGILCETLTFYYGCPNVDQYIDPNTFIRIDLQKPEEAKEIIKTSIANNEWEKRIGLIRAEKQRILKETQFLAFLNKVLS